MTTKQCSKCLIMLETSHFYKQNGGKYGVCAECIDCMLKRQKEKRASVGALNEIQLNKKPSKYCIRCKTIKNDFATYIPGNGNYKILCRVCNECKEIAKNRKNEQKPEIAKRHDRKRIDNLSDSYVKRKIADQRIKYKDIPQELIEAKRLAMLIRRNAQLLRSLNNETSNNAS
jgi:hypothetical protein